jgi:ABC-type multidrug transport system ATPase subunit
VTLYIRHDAVRRGRRIVLEPHHTLVEPPATLALVGINGSGKSSLFMQLTDTLASRGSASITLAGRRPTLAYVPQVPALPPWLRAEQAAGLYGLHFGGLVERLAGLHLAELSGQRVGTMSIGQRQALAIAVALGRDADVTLLDEPFSALDFRRRIGTLDLLRQMRDAGRAIVLSSQSAADLVAVCDHFAVIRDGRYIFDGRRAELVGSADDHDVEQRLLQLLTMPVSAMEAPLRTR